MNELKQKHRELLDNLDIPPTLRAIIYEGILKNEKEYSHSKEIVGQKNVIEINAGKATKGDIMLYVGDILKTVGEHRRGERTFTLYNVTIKIKEAGQI